MESITNAANAAAGAASKIIWGENANNGTQNVTAQSGTEPISGVKGSGTATDPYDGGNKEENIASTKTEGITSSKTDFTPSNTTSSGSGQHVDSLIPPATGNEPTHHTDNAVHPKPADIPHPTQTSKDGNTGGFGTVESSVDAIPKPGQQLPQKQQGADRPKEEPSTSAEHKAVKEDTKSAEAVAERESVTSPAPSGTSGVGGASPGAGPGGVANLSPPKDETSEEAKNATGEIYIKSTGEASQGGDFDASRAGAGREADRLLELKGVDRSTPDAAKHSDSPEVSPSPAADKTEKTSLSTKLKEKLHIGKH